MSFTNETTYEEFKNSILEIIITKPYLSINDWYSRKVGKTIECDETNIKLFFDYISKLCEDLKISEKSNGIKLFLRATMYNLKKKPISEDTVFDSEILLKMLELKDTDSNFCSIDFLKTIANHTKITEEEYVLNSEKLSPYFNILSKNNNLKTDTVNLLHKVSNSKTTLSVTKQERITKNSGSFSLYGKCYKVSDIINQPTSFSWNQILEDEEIKKDEKFLEGCKNIDIKTIWEIFSRCGLYYDKSQLKSFLNIFPNFARDGYEKFLKAPSDENLFFNDLDINNELHYGYVYSSFLKGSLLVKVAYGVTHFDDIKYSPSEVLKKIFHIIKSLLNNEFLYYSNFSKIKPEKLLKNKIDSEEKASKILNAIINAILNDKSIVVERMLNDIIEVINDSIWYR